MKKYVKKDRMSLLTEREYELMDKREKIRWATRAVRSFLNATETTKLSWPFCLLFLPYLKLFQKQYNWPKNWEITEFLGVGYRAARDKKEFETKIIEQMEDMILGEIPEGYNE